MYRSLFALSAILAPFQAVACIPPPPIAPLPGESPEAFQERTRAALAADAFEEQRSMQSALLDKGAAAFIGVVNESREIDIDRVKGHEVAVRAVSAIKGELPKQPMLLRDTTL